MRCLCAKVMFVSLLLLTPVHRSIGSMAIQLGSGGVEFVEPGDAWSFFRGAEPPSELSDGWARVDFDDSTWEIGPSGFGYGDDDDATILDDMRGSYVTVYIRKAFQVTSSPGEEMLELVIDYDDGFIAYLNGMEIARRHLPEGPATCETMASSHEAGSPEIMVLGPARDLLNEGTNVLAIEGHNSSLTSSDLSLIPNLRTASDTVRNGDTWIVETQTVTLSGRTDAADAVTVAIGETAADFDPGDGTWEANVSLVPGLNTLTAQAFNADANEVDSGSVEILYVPPVNHIGGEIGGDTVLSGAYVLEDTVVVPVDVNLAIEPGTVVLMKDGVSVLVSGRLIAEGTEDRPIRFTHYGDGSAWKQMRFVEAADSRLVHCIIEYADCEGAHQDYYEPGARDYHEAVVVLAGHLDVNDCTFQNLPDDGSGAEGDAIAVISDDPDRPGEATAHIVGCRFLSIGQGVHTRYSYVLVEDCFFTGKRGDNDDVDLWGESEPAPLIRNNVFLNPEHDDAINPTRCSAVIIGNIISGTDDHGIVLRDKCSPVLINNVIHDCRNGGIAIENSCEASLVNNTIVGCGRGLRLFDLGRWGPPYRLNPGGGTATVTNCVIWDCPTPITLADSSNTEIADRGSHITIMYSDIEGGRDGVSVSGSRSTLTWGQGNIDAAPLFADPSILDFHLKSQFGRWDPESESWVSDEVTSPCIDAGDPDTPVGEESFPNGHLVNMGAYGGTDQASKSPDDAPALGLVADTSVARGAS